MKHNHKQPAQRWNALLLVVVLMAGAVLLPRFVSVQDSINTLRNADHAYVWLAIIATASTFFSAALVYVCIALRPLAFGTTLLVQVASGFTNRLMPLGTGIIALNVDYLIRRKHTAAQAGALVALNNLLGFIGMMLLILLAVVASPGSITGSFDWHPHVSRVWVWVVLTIFIVGTVLLFVIGKRVLAQIKSAVVLVVRSSTERPGRLLLALFASMLITVGFAGTLYALGLGFNAHLTAVQALLVLTIGVVSASVTPTPGGLGGAEVGLIAALVAAGIMPHQAVTLAITYRFITYWLPILPGLASFQILLNKRYI